MNNEFSHLHGEEQLRAENEFIKMKLMLERGAQFGTGDGDLELPAGLENQFLNNILEFEEQFANQEKATVFERLDQPAHFKPVKEIPDTEIDQAWHELSVYLEEHGISLDVCSPNISNRELYRFATEELFLHEMDVINIPGMMSCFIYDEFHPDPVYDTSRMVEQDLLRDIFSISKLFYEINYCKDGFEFNGRTFTDRKEFIEMIDRFKSFYDGIELDECEIAECVVNDHISVVKGIYAATAKAGHVVTVFTGEFSVECRKDELEYWNFKRIMIQGFDPK